MSEDNVQQAFEELREIVQKDDWSRQGWDNFHSAFESHADQLKQERRLGEFKERYLDYFNREVVKWPIVYREHRYYKDHSLSVGVETLGAESLSTKKAFKDKLKGDWSKVPWGELTVLDLHNCAYASFIVLELMRKMPAFKGVYLYDHSLPEGEGKATHPGIVRMLNTMIDEHGNTLEYLDFHLWGQRDSEVLDSVLEVLMARSVEVPNLKAFGWFSGAEYSTKIVEFLSHEVSENLQDLRFSSVHSGSMNHVIEALATRKASLNLKRVMVVASDAEAKKLTESEYLQNVEVWDLRLNGEDYYGDSCFEWDSPAAERWRGKLERQLSPDVVPSALDKTMVDFGYGVSAQAMMETLADDDQNLIRAPKVEELVFHDLPGVVLASLLEQGLDAYPGLNTLRLGRMMGLHNFRCLARSEFAERLETFEVWSSSDHQGLARKMNWDDMEGFEENAREWLEFLGDKSVPKPFRRAGWKYFLECSPSQVKHHRKRAELMGLPEEIWKKASYKKFKVDLERFVEIELES